MGIFFFFLNFKNNLICNFCLFLLISLCKILSRSNFISWLIRWLLLPLNPILGYCSIFFFDFLNFWLILSLWSNPSSSGSWFLIFLFFGLRDLKICCSCWIIINFFFNNLFFNWFGFYLLIFNFCFFFFFLLFYFFDLLLFFLNLLLFAWRWFRHFISALFFIN